MISFVKRWLGGEDAVAVGPYIPQGQRVYCIGDIHGRLDLLHQLHRAIATDAKGYDGEKIITYLGDYIDRGEQSKEVVELLIKEPLKGFHSIHLLGNHEQSLLDFLQHPMDVASWLKYGGRATLLSYGVAVGPKNSREDLQGLRDELERKLPQRHLDFYRELYLAYVAGSYCFVHAGIRPGLSVRDQRDEDLLWIREDFTKSREIHEHIVVHGHSITSEVEFWPNRIGIDTGAFHTGVLTCLVLEGSEQRLLQTGRR